MNKNGLITGLLLIAGWSVAQTNATKPSEGKNSDKTDRIAELLQVGNDPFRQDISEGNASVGTGVAMDATRISSAIQMKGILCICGKEPYALVQIDRSEAQLVRKGDLILLPQSKTKRVDHQSLQTEMTPKYLLVTEINKDCIMVAPRQRPQEQITIR